MQKDSWTDLCIFVDRNKYFRVNLPASLAAGQQTTVTVESSYTHALRPYPSQIAQAEKQFVQFFGNALFYSPYKTTTQTTTVNCPTSSIESYTKTVKPVSQSDSTVTYGPFENKDPFSKVRTSRNFDCHWFCLRFLGQAESFRF